jgi:hypothetical protein
MTVNFARKKNCINNTNQSTNIPASHAKAFTTGGKIAYKNQHVDKSRKKL